MDITFRLQTQYFGRFYGISRLILCFWALLLTPLRPLHAVDFSSSYSFIRFNFFGSPFSAHVNVALISSSFNDLFTKLDVTSTEFEFRALEGQQEVDREKIAKYVADKYSALAEKERKEIEEVLFEAKEADEILKAKMASPTLSDDLKIMYAQERERLLKNVYDFEAETQRAYFQKSKPAAYQEFSEATGKIDDMYDDALLCELDITGCRVGMEPGKAMDSLIRAVESEAIKLSQAPLQLKNLDSQVSQKFLIDNQYNLRKLSAYVKNLYVVSKKI